MNIIRTEFEDVVIFEDNVYHDHRGHFQETFRESWFDTLKDKPKFVQDNMSFSNYNVFRGLHLQKNNSQGKLLKVVSGEIVDIVVDMRLASPTYGLCKEFNLTSQLNQSIWIPEGYAHGFYVTSDVAIVQYKCTEIYSPEDNITVNYDSIPSLRYLKTRDLILSDKDTKGIDFKIGVGFDEDFKWKS